MEVDLVSDLFTVSGGDEREMLLAVERLGYRPRVMREREAAAMRKAAPPLPPMPASVREAIDRARAAGKLVAFKCFADG